MVHALNDEAVGKMDPKLPQHLKFRSSSSVPNIHRATTTEVRAGAVELSLLRHDRKTTPGLGASAEVPRQHTQLNAIYISRKL